MAEKKEVFFFGLGPSPVRARVGGPYTWRVGTRPGGHLRVLTGRATLRTNLQRQLLVSTRFQCCLTPTTPLLVKTFPPPLCPLM